jgi:hypothetical protein
VPAHQVNGHDLVAFLTKLERTGEQVVTITPFAGFSYVVVTRLTNPVETRLAAVTHAARVGADTWDRDPLLHSFITDHIVVDEVTE